MERYIQSGIELSGAHLRYVEIERRGPQFWLRRLGECAFPFALDRPFNHRKAVAQANVLAQALADIFDDSRADELRIALHPNEALSFFVPVPAEASAHDSAVQLRYEANLLIKAKGGGPRRITPGLMFHQTLPNGLETNWIHVLAVEEALHKQFDRVLTGLPQAKYRFKGTAQGVVTILTQLHETGQLADTQTLTLALGWYPHHFELTILKPGQWHFTHHFNHASVGDCTYFALTALERMNLWPRSVGHCVIYGENVDHFDISLFEKAFGLVPVRLNPFQLVTMDTSGLKDNFVAEAYAPCIGVALA